MKKYLSAILAVVVCALFALSAGAAEATVYVKDGGTGDGTSAAYALGSFADAVDALGKSGGTIVLCGDVSISEKTTIPEQAANLTITAQGGARLVVSARLQLAKNTNDNVVTIDAPIDIAANYACFFFGGFNNVVFTENFAVTKSGGSAAALSFFGGVHAGEASDVWEASATLPYRIEVNGGTFADFRGGNLRNGSTQVLGSIAAPVEIVINNGTFGVSGVYDASLNNKNYSDISISGMSILADDATFTVNGGTFFYPITASGRRGAVSSLASQDSGPLNSDRSYYAVDGDITVNLNGGSFYGGAVSAAYTEASHIQVLRGNYTLNVGDGAVFSAGTVFDATQVVAYTGTSTKATFNGGSGYDIRRFDMVNGAETDYEEPLRVTFIGDSITEGVGSTNSLLNSYPARFLENATADGREVIVTNLGVGSAGMLPSTKRYYGDMLAYALAMGETEADYYICALGTNDANSVGASGGAMQEFYTRYKALIEALGNLPNTKKVYVTSALICDLIYSHGIRNTALRPLQKQIADELAATSDKYVYVDIYALMSDEAAAETLFNYDTTDRIHPSDIGHEAYGRAIYDAVFNGVCTVSDYESSDIYISQAGDPFGAGTADDPIGNLPYAMGKLAKNGTLHVIGSFDYAFNFNTPYGTESLTIVGEGSGAALNFTASGEATVKFCGDTTLDNITLNKPQSALTIVNNYGNLYVTDTVATAGVVNLYLGHLVQKERSEESVEADGYYDTLETASSSNDFTARINGGTYALFLGGNRRIASDAPIGFYSGSMTLEIGENVSVTSTATTGIVGMNYLSGSINATVRGFGSIPLSEYSRIGSLAGGIKFDCGNNTGRVTLDVSEGAAGEILLAYDLDGDATIDIRDLLVAIKSIVDGTSEAVKAHFFSKDITLLDALNMFKRLAA